MKKIIFALLVIILITSAIALADSVNPVGCWVRYELLNTGAPSMTMLYLSEDHSCYYLVQTYKEDGPGLGRAYVGTWEYKPDGIVYAKTGDNTDTQLSIADNSAVAVDIKTYKYYMNISPYGLF